MEKGKLLIYSNTTEGEAYVLEGSDDLGQDVRDNGPNVNDWPSDFGIYDRGAGLYVWEGEVNGDHDEFTGTLRELNQDEWKRLHENVPVFG